MRTPRYAMMSSPALRAAAGLGVAAARPLVRAAAVALLLAGEVDGIARERAAPAKNGDFRTCARDMNAAGCDERDLVVFVLPWPRQALELNLRLDGAPPQEIVEGNFDPGALARPWRNIWLVVWDQRPRAGEGVAPFIGREFPGREPRRHDRLALRRFSK